MTYSDSASTPALREALGCYANTLRVIRYDTVDSTNTAAKADAEAADTPALYVARTQTGGRGRLGRSFHSPADTGLYMTVAYTTEKPLSEAVRITAGAAVAALSSIEALTDLRPAVKWVNDLYLDGCKVGGILTEAVTRADGRTRMVIGWGINLTTTTFPDGLRAPAACLFQNEDASSFTPDFAERLAGTITRRLLELVDASPDGLFPGGVDGAVCLDFYRRHLLYVGETVLCVRGSESFSGIVQGVDRDYSLLIRAGDAVLPLSSGEISIRPLPRS